MNAKLTTVFIDLAGSSAAYEALDNQAVADMVSMLTRWMDQVCVSHGGRTRKFLGDGVLVQFADVVQALRAVVFLQKNYATQSLAAISSVALPSEDAMAQLLERPDALHMGLKIGMASGTVVEVNADAYGDSINLAARLCAMAGSGAIWADESVIKLASADVPDGRRGGLYALPLDAGQCRSLGPVPVHGLSTAREVFQILWKPETVGDNLTKPATLSELEPPPAPATSRITLTYLDSVRTFNASDDPVIRIGRGESNDVVITEQRVSRQHARIEWVNGAFELTDLSSYGTWVRFNDAAGSEVLLRRSQCLLHSSGELALGVAFADFSAPVLAFQVNAAPHAGTTSTIELPIDPR